MPTIQSSGRREYNGLFLLDRNDLKELDAVLAEIQKQAKKYYSHRLREVMASNLSQLQRLYPSKSVEELKSEARKLAENSYELRHKFCQVVAYCASKNKATAKTFSELICLEKLNGEVVTHSEVNLRYADLNASINIFDIYSDRIRIDIEPMDRVISQQLSQQIGSWVESKARAEFFSKYRSEIIGILWLAIWLCLALLATAGLRYEQPQDDSTKQTAASLLKAGIDDNNIADAVECLLKLNTESAKKPRVVGVKWVFVVVAACPLVLLCAILLFPKSALALGRSSRFVARGRHRLSLAKLVAGTAFGSIPASVIANAIWSVLSNG